jgi:hypothetical protein
MGFARERSHREREKTKGQKNPYERILIVSEGKKTEPNYFNEIRIMLRLSEVFIKVMHCVTGTTPLQVVSFLEKLLKDKPPYDLGYCVFDRDEHPGYTDAIAKAKVLDDKIKNDEGQRIRIQAIYSNPCFELWLLSHFPAHVERHIERNEVVSLVKTCIPGYEKGSSGVFKKTQISIDKAYAHAERMRQLCENRGTDNPQTLVDILVRKLLSQKK